MHYYFDSYILGSTPLGFNGWMAPENALSVLDFRSVPEQSSKGEVSGKGFFAYANVNTNRDLYLGDSLTASVTPSLRTAIEQRLGLTGGELTATTVLDVIAQLYTELADPTGNIRWRPVLSPEIHLANHSKIWQGNWQANPVWRKKWLGVRQHDYRQIRQECLDQTGPNPYHPDLYRKVLDYWSKRYGINSELFIPKDLPIELPLLHSTTIGDTFVETSNTALGSHTATGPNGGFSWTITSGGSFSVIAATDDCDSTSSAHNNARAESDLSGDDHYAQTDGTLTLGSGRDVGVIARYSASADTGYIVLTGGTAGDTILYKVIASSYTLIHDYNDAETSYSSDQIKLEVDASNLTPTMKGTTKSTQTDTAITGNLRCGIRAYNNLSTLDNFEAADLVAGGTTPKNRALNGPFYGAFSGPF